MGLNFPSDLEGWQDWQNRQQSLARRFRRTTGLTTRTGAVSSWLVKGGPSPTIVMVLDSMGSTSTKSLLEPLRYIDPELVAVIAPDDPTEQLLPHHWQRSFGSTEDAFKAVEPSSRVMCALGHYLPRGAYAYQRTLHNSGVHFVTIQHGILTAYTPPLAQGTVLLAWTENDAEFWVGSRDDVSVNVAGSQLLWAAAQRSLSSPRALTRQPVFLGQLHGAELDFSLAAESARAFCLDNRAIYRPHPAETDRRSRRTHRRWEREGIQIDRKHEPLFELGSPIVSTFSTGILEASAVGLPAWVFHLEPPNWLMEVWQRYAMGSWRQQPTTPPRIPTIEPSRTIATEVQRLAQ